MTDTGVTAVPSASEPDPVGGSLVGRRLGEFVIREELSSGGFGTVYRAEQPALAREAVIKVLHRRLSASEPLVQRFLREARVASRLDHPYAAHIYAFGAEPDGVLWIAMELVRGTPLDKLLAAQGPLPLERFAPLLERLCQVVQTAHDQGIVHRDIKPANVMVLARAGQLLPKLLDLGIAKHGADDAPRPPARETSDDLEAFATTMAPVEAGDLGDTQPSDGPPITPAGRLTEEGAIMGSPLYMAPEQWTDAGTVDARTDIYALGVLCHEALTNKPPFDGLNRFAIAMAHAREKPPPLGDRFPAALDAVVARALAKRPADRYASALELAAAFRAASGLADEPVALPRLADELRVRVLASAPRPIAHAVALLEAARNAHQARDALWQLVRVVVRTLATIALSAHSHVGAGGAISDSSVSESLRKLRRRAMPDAEWLALARELATSFRALRDAYPVPELVDFFAGDAPASLSELVELRDASDVGAADDEVRELLVTALPHAEQLLRSLEFLAEYRLVVVGDRGAEVWMGARRGEAPTLALRGAALAPGQPALADATGTPVISLWPFVQCHEPAPGVAAQLFFFEGKGRRGARLVALPDKFEHEDDALWEVLGGLVEGTTTPVAEPGSDDTSPYPGLASFTVADAGRFFGRERETETVVNRLHAQALLAVVGPSGAGKSSFVQAGVVPSLPDDWHVVTLRPGPSPLASLASRLASAGFEARRIETELAAGPDRLGAFLRTRTTGTLLIVVDQLEELFTLCEDAAERERFVDVLVRAARAPDDPIRVVFTLRDDFLLHAEALPALRSRLALALHLLTTPSRDDLLRILDTPLRQAGYELDDPALAGEMVDALAETRSPLALLSFTASKLWELRDRRFRQLSRKAYVSLGGVGGALARHAETTLEAMSPEEQRLVREVFRHAVTSEGTRATLSRAELDQVLGGGLHGKAVVEKLVAARLLVVAESATGREQIEITHEALIDAWPRLVAWRHEDAEGARLRDQLRAAARQWDERGRPTGLLWRGDALAELRLWRSRYPGTLTDVEHAFATASTEDASRAARRRRTWIAGAFATLVAGLVALLLLNARVANQRSRAEASQRAAESAEREAKDNAEKLRANLLAQYEDQGRRRVIEGDPHQALVYLHKAESLGARGRAHDLLVAFAVRILRSKVLQVEHDNIVKTVRFTTSGARFVTASDDGRARLWDAREGRRLAEVAHDAGIVNAELSRDEKLLVTASLDGTAGVWDVATGRRLHALRHGSPLQAVLLSADARSVATIGADDVVRVWDLATGTPRFTVHEPHQPAGVLSGIPGAFSPDGTRLAVGDNRGVWRVWDATSGALIATGRGHQMQLNTVRFSADGRRIVTASNDSTAAVWEAATGKRLFVLQHADRVNVAELGAGDRFVATASNDRTAVLWDAATGARVLTMQGHTAGVNAIAFRPDGRQLATASDDTTAMLWDVATGQREARLLGHGGALLDVQYERSGQVLVTAGDDRRAIVWRATSQLPTRRMHGHRGVISTIAFAPDGRRLVTAGSDGTSRVWDREGRQLRIRVHDGPVESARFSPDGELVASGGADTKLHVWNARTGAVVDTFSGHASSIRDVAWHPDGKRLVTASRDGTARIWTLGSRESILLRGHEATVVTATWSPTGDTLVTTSQDKSTRLWSATGAELSRRIDPDIVTSAAFDPSGTLIAGSTLQTMAKIWRAADGVVVAELLGHASSLQSTQWSPDGAFIVTASIDATARIWDAKRGDLLAVLGDDRSLIYAATYAPDGRSIATASDDVASIWELPPPVTDVRELVRCEVPFELQENRLIRVPRPPGCTPRTP